MNRVLCASLGLALLPFLVAASPASAGPPSLDEIVGELEDWLDANSDLPRRTAPPTIRLLPMSLAAGIYGGAGFMGGTLRAFYDGETATVTLVTPWNAESAEDRSVLLHELVHHRQAPLHAYCEGAKELPAYKLQAAWAFEQGAEPEINWIAAVLEAGCSARDKHPD